MDEFWDNGPSYDSSTSDLSGDWGGYDQIFNPSYDFGGSDFTSYDNLDTWLSGLDPYTSSGTDLTGDWGGYDQIFNTPVDTTDYSGMYNSGIYGSEPISNSVENPISNYNTYTGTGDTIINDANGNPLGYIDKNGQYQSYSDLRDSALQGVTSAAPKGNISGGSGGGSGGSSQQPKQQTAPAQTNAQKAVGTLAYLAQMLQAIAGRGAKAPTGLGTNRAATGMNWSTQGLTRGSPLNNLKG